jgi:hypothetical protein
MLGVEWCDHWFGRMESVVRMMHRKKFPAAREDGVLVEQVADETIVYVTDSKEVHCLSPLASAVYASCDGRTSMERLARAASERLGETVTEANVREALIQLEARELMAFPLASGNGGMSRRDMLQRSAAAVAGGALITTVVAPPAIAANSATCANLLCCPCCKQESLNKEECCTITNVTVNCQCTNAARLVDYAGAPTNNNCAKYCKPSANAAPDDLQCQDLYATNAEAKATCELVAGFPTAGFDACLECANCPN